MKRKNHNHQVNWTRNSYFKDGKKYTTVTGHNYRTGETVKKFTIKHKRY